MENFDSFVEKFDALFLQTIQNEDLDEDDYAPTYEKALKILKEFADKSKTDNTWTLNFMKSFKA